MMFVLALVSMSTLSMSHPEIRAVMTKGSKWDTCKDLIAALDEMVGGMANLVDLPHIATFGGSAFALHDDMDALDSRWDAIPFLLLSARSSRWFRIIAVFSIALSAPYEILERRVVVEKFV